jgi:hypothetical protein
MCACIFRYVWVLRVCLHVRTDILEVQAFEFRLRRKNAGVKGGCDVLSNTYYSAAPAGWSVITYRAEVDQGGGGEHGYSIKVGGAEPAVFYIRDRAQHNFSNEGALDATDGKSRFVIKGSVNGSEASFYEHVSVTRLAGIIASGRACARSWWGPGSWVNVKVYATLAPLSMMHAAGLSHPAP